MTNSPVNTAQSDEITSLKQGGTKTIRPVSAALEEILYEPLPVLDHGFVRVVDYMGVDESIVQAARVSYGKGTKKTSQDKGLINYLLRHRHNTPFEMCEIKFHIKLPMFVARQWIRHRTANVNEYSARYSILDKEFYIPTDEHLAAQSKINNQGRGDVLKGEEAKQALELLKRDALQCYDTYQTLLNEDAEGNILDENKNGLARELARMNLPVNFYTQWYWKIDLSNLMHFVSLRADHHSQYEIRAYADVILGIMEKWVPYAYDAFMAYRKTGAHFSGKGVEVIKQMLKGEKPTQETSGMTKREWEELMATLNLNKA